MARREGCLRRSSWVAAAFVALVAACGGGGGGPADASDAADGSRDADARVAWNCPADWVPLAVGGCAPAVMACVADGGALAGACASMDLAVPHAVTDADGGTGTAFFRAPDGALRGGWHDPGDPNGYPSADFVPDAGTGAAGDAWAPEAGIGSCPTGWTAQADGTCDVALATDCGAGAAALPGGLCTATAASDCPAGTYADVGAETVGATVVYVLAGSDATMADGTMAHPFATIGAGIAAAGADGWVLVGAGTYAESLAPSASVHIVGACSARVSIQTSGNMAAVHAAGATVSLDLRGVMLTGAGPGLVVDTGAHAAVRALEVSMAQRRALSAADDGTQLTGSDVYVHDPMVTATSAGEALGLLVMNGASVTLSRIAIDRAVHKAVWAFGAGSTIALSDAVVSNTLLGTETLTQSGIFAFSGASIAMVRALLDGNAVTAATAISDGAVLLTDCVVRHTTQTATDPAVALSASNAPIMATRVLVTDTEGSAVVASSSTVTLSQCVLRASAAATSGPTTTGFGIDASGGMVAIDHSVIDGSHTNGISMQPATDMGQLTVDHCIVRNTAPAGTHPTIGITVGGGSSGRVAATLVERNGNIGVNANDTMSTMAVTDSVIREARETVHQPSAGLTASGGATLSIANSVVTGVDGAGAVIQGAGTHFQMQGTVVRDIVSVPLSSMPFGAGVIVAEGAVSTMQQSTIHDVALFGVTVAQQNETGTALTIDDSAIDGTVPQVVDAMGHTFGAGLGVSFGAALTVERTVVSDSSPIGAFAAGTGASLVLRDSTVRGTHVGSTDRAAAAVMASGGGAVQAVRLLVTDGQDTGLVAIAGGTLDVADSIVTGIAPDMIGFGTGIDASGDGTVTLHRVAVTDVSGAALMATPYEDPMTPQTTGASITGEDVYVHAIASSSIRVTYAADGTPMRDGTTVAYGAHAGTACSLTIDRGVFDQGGYGFFVSSGALTLRTGVVSSMLDAAGAQSGASATLDGVAFVGNAQDAVVPGPDLPEGAMLQSPQPACSTPGCL